VRVDQVRVGQVRVGQGIDVHAFSDDPARPLVLAGVEIPGGPGLAGHSDADAVLHAIVDALLGAAGLGDIGALFGSEDPAYRGADSRVFLAQALAAVAEAGLAVANADVTVVAARPRIGPHRERMRARIAELLGVPRSLVNVKATTTDGLGFTGRGEGVAALAVVLLQAAGPSPEGR